MAIASNFSIEGRAGSVIKDIQRSWMWEVSFPGLASVVSLPASLDLGSGGLDEELTVRAKSITIPARGIEMIPSNFGAFVQQFPGKHSIDQTVSINFEESENGNLHLIMTEWINTVFNIKSGHSKKAGGKRGILGTSYVLPNMVLTLKNYAGESRDKQIIYKNVVPQSVGSVEMSYDSNSSQIFAVTFQYDLWFLGKITDVSFEA